uniref:YchJ-like middle NTF2-like domain-containing protein n=1 Tax=Haptolina ericina TaxID=156174 RepID=A0A7S3BIJ8_9EUKA
MEYSACCQPCHEALRVDSSPSALVRARYTAFCYRLPDFLMSTTDPEGSEWQPDGAAWKKSMLGFMDNLDFQKLRVVDEQLGSAPDEASVHFRATFVQKGSINIVDAVERSQFVRRDGHWLYASGVVEYEAPQD